MVLATTHCSVPFSNGVVPAEGTAYLNLQTCKGVGMPIAQEESPSCLGLHILLQFEERQYEMTRLLAVITSELVITATTISSASRVSPGMGEWSLHGSKIYRDGAWGIRVASGLSMRPSHPHRHNCSPFKVCRVLNKHLYTDRRC